MASLKHLVEVCGLNGNDMTIHDYCEQIYILPLRKLHETEGVTPILTAQEMSRLFSSIELILNVNEELLASLEELLAPENDIQYGLGDVFLKFVRYFL